MREIEVVVNHESGLHLRPAALFVLTAAGYKSDIMVRNITRDGKFYNAKSAINVMMLQVLKGDSILIQAEGEDADEALQGLQRLIESDFETA